MSIIKKRLFALLMTMVMALSLSVSAFAAEPVDITQEPTTVASEEVSTRSAGKLLASNTTTINNGSGTLVVHLYSGNFLADIVACIGYSPRPGVINCSVTTPNGDFIDLGSVSGTGSLTSSYELFYAPAGDYIFYFSSAIAEPFNVIGYIYD